MFVKYRDINGDSNIDCYEIGIDYIAIKFNNSSKIYRYSCYRAGKTHVENMKKYAAKGNGLNSYINLHCRSLYDK